MAKSRVATFLHASVVCFEILAKCPYHDGDDQAHHDEAPVAYKPEYGDDVRLA